jgi:hypothetical protein
MKFTLLVFFFFAGITLANDHLLLTKLNLPLVPEPPHVFVDSATWCQYLVFPQGATARLDSKGAPICLDLDSLRKSNQIK